MSLVCTETRKYIMYGAPLYCGTLRGQESFYCALSKEVVDRIPSEERRPTPCATEQDGVDIYEGTSTKNFTGAYSLFDFEKEKFLFSVSSETAKQYIPHLWAEYWPGHQPTPISVNITVIDTPPGKPN